MREQPAGQNLLETARNTLLEKVLPLIPQDQRYNALMVANAMAIALRQWQAGDTWQQEELTRLQALPGIDVPADADLQNALLTANRQLTQKIRKGEFDQASAAQGALLMWMATQRVRESAPKALQTTKK